MNAVDIDLDDSELVIFVVGSMSCLSAMVFGLCRFFGVSVGAGCYGGCVE